MLMDIGKLRKQRNIFYRSIGSVYCPALQDDVKFTSQGFHHLIYSSNKGKPGRNKLRGINETYLKLQLLKYAPNVIKNSKEIVKIREVREKRGNKTKTALQFELSHKIDPTLTVRVIVIKVGDGAYKFLSVMRGKKVKSKNTLAKRPRRS
jgi:hypothetical protein